MTMKTNRSITSTGLHCNTLAMAVTQRLLVGAAAVAPAVPPEGPTVGDTGRPRDSDQQAHPVTDLCGSCPCVRDNE
jgi:hypothetical protein